MQAALPCLVYADGEVDLTLLGGTNADMAPQIDYALMVSYTVRRGVSQAARWLTKFLLFQVYTVVKVEVRFALLLLAPHQFLGTLL